MSHAAYRRFHPRSETAAKHSRRKGSNGAPKLDGHQFQTTAQGLSGTSLRGPRAEGEASSQKPTITRNLRLHLGGKLRCRGGPSPLLGSTRESASQLRSALPCQPVRMHGRHETAVPLYARVDQSL